MNFPVTTKISISKYIKLCKADKQLSCFVLCIDLSAVGRNSYILDGWIRYEKFCVNYKIRIIRIYRYIDIDTVARINHSIV